MNEIQKWADDAMFKAEPLKASDGPKVYLVWMTPDPLGAVAAMAKMYKGEVVRSLSDVTNAERQEYMTQIMKTKLKAPLEAVKLHFMIEGVTRSFTHQMVRQRTAVYAQESLRFAVKEDMGEGVALPPSLMGTRGTEEILAEQGNGHQHLDERTLAYLSNEEKMRVKWDHCVEIIDDTYNGLINMGMPAEDARGLLPHNITTRLNYVTDFRALLDHAGNRLCTQAQFEWRQVMAQLANAIRNYKPHEARIESMGGREVSLFNADADLIIGLEHLDGSDAWQFEALASTLRPVCYNTGKCEFMANFDRACSIRDRVEANHAIGRASSEWGEEYDHVKGNPIVSGVGPQSVVRDEDNTPVFIGAIQPREWLLDPGSAR